jgi:hypothetical protein
VSNNNDGNEVMQSYLSDSITLSMAGMLFENTSNDRHYPEKLMTMLENGFLTFNQQKNYVGILTAIIADAASDTVGKQVASLMGAMPADPDKARLERLNKLSFRLENYLDDQWALASGRMEGTICWLAFQRSMLPHLVGQINGEEGEMGLEALFEVVNTLPRACATAEDAAVAADNISMRLVKVLWQKLSLNHYYGVGEAREVFKNLTEVANRFALKSEENAGFMTQEVMDAYAMQMFLVLDSIEDKEHGVTSASSWISVANMLRHNLSKIYPIVESRIPNKINSDEQGIRVAEQAILYMKKIFYYAAMSVADFRRSPDEKTRNAVLSRISAVLDEEGKVFRGNMMPSPFRKKKDISIWDILSTQEYVANLFMKRIRMKYLLECESKNIWLCRAEANSATCRYSDNTIKCN